MNSKRSLVTVFYFPFQTKRLIRFTWISLIVFGLWLPASAGDDVRQTAPDSRQLIKQAEKFVRKGDFAEAERLLRRALEQNPAETKAKLSLSYILLKQQRLRESYDLSFAVVQAEPKNARAFALVGMALANSGNFKDAKLLLKNANLLNDKESLAWAGMGMIDFYENRITESWNKLREAEYLEPAEPDYIFTLAQVLARAEMYKEAAEAYQRFLQISPATDIDRRDRIKGLIRFLQYIGTKQRLYAITKDSRQTTLPFKLVNYRPIFELKIGNSKEKFRFVLDTGSGVSVVSEEAAKRLKMKPIARGGKARAVGGNGKFEIVYGFLKSINLGEVKIENIPVYIRKFHENSEKVDGYIGLSLISKFLTTVDYGNSTFTLTKKNQASVEQFETEAVAFPLRLTSSGFLSGEVQLEGVESSQNFIVDTGASISVISDELASTDGLSRFLTTEKMRVVGAAGVTENVQMFLLPKMTFGTHSCEAIKAVALDLDVINESAGFRQAGILGGNFLKNYRLTFDFQNSRVTFVPVNSAAASERLPKTP